MHRVRWDDKSAALVHEAHLRLVGDRDVHWSGKAHFYVAAAEAMRRILLDHARSRGRLKRGGVRVRLSRRSPCEGACPEDIDGSGAVDFGDVLAVLTAWGSCE